MSFAFKGSIYELGSVTDASDPSFQKCSDLEGYLRDWKGDRVYCPTLVAVKTGNDKLRIAHLMQATPFVKVNFGTPAGIHYYYCNDIFYTPVLDDPEDEPFYMKDS